MGYDGAHTVGEEKIDFEHETPQLRVSHYQKHLRWKDLMDGALDSKQHMTGYLFLD